MVNSELPFRKGDIQMNDINNQNNIPSVPPTPPQPQNYPANQTPPPAPVPQQPVQQPYIPQQPVQPAPQPVQPPQAPVPPAPQQPVPPAQQPQQVPVQPQSAPTQPVQPEVQPQPVPGQPTPPHVQPPVYQQTPSNTAQPPVQGQTFNAQNVNPYPNTAQNQYNNYNNPNYAYTPKTPASQPMSSGVKAFIVIVIAILVASLIAFVAYISVNPSSSSSFDTPLPTNAEPEFTSPTREYSFTEPETTPQSNKEYKKSDAHDKTNPKFSGIKLNKKPKKNSKSGTQYAFNKAQKSVVGIICYTDDQEGTATSYTTMGSGIIADSDGYIVTNAHIINNSRTAYLLKVITSDKKTYDAGIVGYDSRYDLAVLKVDAKNLPAAEFGDSNSLKIAEDVIAIGNPRSINYQNSVTKGIVSALNRQASTTNNSRFIQTDTPINPGNSGGPLCNMYGQVVGITTSKIALDDYEGMGFAIPSSTVKNVADSIIKYSYVKNRVRIGIVGEITTKDLDGAYGIKITEISKGGPMDNTGAKNGDIITKVDGKSISTFAEVYDILEKHKSGDKVKVTLYRPSTEKTYDITITLQEDKN